MKLVVIRFGDAVNISALTVGGAVSVKIGTTEIAEGTVSTTSSMENPAASELVPHTHAFDAPVGTSGPAIP